MSTSKPPLHPMFTPHGKITRALCEAAEEFASDPIIWDRRARQATEILENYVRAPKSVSPPRDEFCVSIYKTTGKFYSEETVSLPRPTEFESRGELWKRMVDHAGGTVPGLMTSADDCEYVIVVEPSDGEGNPPRAWSQVPFVVMPTKREADRSPDGGL